MKSLLVAKISTVSIRMDPQSEYYSDRQIHLFSFSISIHTKPRVKSGLKLEKLENSWNNLEKSWTKT